MMQKRIAREARRLSEMRRDKSQIAQSLEAEWEWKLHALLARQREQAGAADSASVSSFDRAGSRGSSTLDKRLPSADVDTGSLDLDPRPPPPLLVLSGHAASLTPY
jgi:hypothetical protein